MADQEHLDILKRGVKVWNEWREANSRIQPDLSGADLSSANLSRANLSDAYLSGANLSKAILSEANFNGAILSVANFSGANLRGALLSSTELSSTDLREADLTDAYLSGANLYGANLSGVILSSADLSGANLSDAKLSGVNLSVAKLSGADLSGALLSRANLSDAKLREADLSDANLSGANLRHANLSGANLRSANLRSANLRSAVCSQADFSDALLSEACLINSHLNGATLNRARLWETQRAGWSVKGITCESVYWDAEGKELTTFNPGDFERLYAEKVRVLIKYPDGISPLEIVTLPALIQHLAASRPGCKLRFESILEASGGAIVSIVVEDAKDIAPGQMEMLRAALQSEAEEKAQRLRQALESESRTVLSLRGEVNALERMVDRLVSKPTYYLKGGDVKMGDEYNIGQAGAAGPNAHAHDMTFNQIGGNIEKSMSLAQLADELAKLRQAMSQEAQNPSHFITLGKVAEAEVAAKEQNSSKVAESLKAAGKWALDVSTKIGVSVATEAIKQSMGMK